METGGTTEKVGETWKRKGGGRIGGSLQTPGVLLVLLNQLSRNNLREISEVWMKIALLFDQV